MILSGRHAAALFGCVIVIAAGCTSSKATPGAPSAAPSGAAGSVAPTAAAAPSAAASAPAFDQIEPAAAIDVPGAKGAIAITTDGTTVWAVGQGVVLRIDAATNAVEQLAAPVESDDTTLAIADDGLWATRWAGGHLYRLDPRTGAVELSVEMPSAVRLAFIDEQLWVGQEERGTMVRIDRQTGARGALVTQGAYGAAGLGDLWFAGKSSTARRVDPATDAIKATIDAPGESNCGISGAFPDNVWTSCFGRELEERSVARIDPIANRVATVVKVPKSAGGAVLMINGQPWFVGAFAASSGPFVGLLMLDRETGAIERSFAVEGVDPDGSVVAGGALWIADEMGKRIVRVDLADLSN